MLNLCMNYMIHVFSKMWRIKNQPSNSTSYSDNALRLLVLVAGRLYWGLKWHLSFNWGLRFEGLFWERDILKDQIAFEGHWWLHSWTLVNSQYCEVAECRGIALAICGGFFSHKTIINLRPTWEWESRPVPGQLFGPMIGENLQLVTDEPGEFEK